LGFLGAIVAFAAGTGVSWINYLISSYILKNYPDKYSFSTLLRQIVQIAFVVLLYIISGQLPVSRWYVLIGGVAGLTVGMFCFTFMLLKQNEIEKSTDSIQENGEGSNG